MIKSSFIFHLLLFILFTSCAARKQLTEIENQPGWVKTKPWVVGYYVGIGSSHKTGLPNEYRERAKQDALADLAGEIAVQVSTTSVLYTIENEYGNVDFYDQKISISSEDYLADFEKVETYETEDKYWVYYRINKQTYAETKARRKAEAVQLALANFESGCEVLEANKPADAIRFYLKGLEAIKPYMQENTAVDYNGEMIDIGNELLISLEHTISSILIRPVADLLQIKHADTTTQAAFLVTYNDNPVKNIPVNFKYSGGYLPENYTYSDKDGLSYVKVNRSVSDMRDGRINASVDFEAIARKAVNDPFVKSMVKAFITQGATMNVISIKPRIGLIIQNNFCLEFPCKELFSLLEENVRLYDYEYEKDSSNQDYTFLMNLKIDSGETAAELTSVYLEGDLNLMSYWGENIWSKSIKPIKGIGKSRAPAEEEAFEKLLKNLNLIYYREGLEKIR